MLFSHHVGRFALSGRLRSPALAYRRSQKEPPAKMATEGATMVNHLGLTTLVRLQSSQANEKRGVEDTYLNTLNKLEYIE